MSQADELLDSLTEDQVMTTSVEPATEPHIVINADKTVTIPEALKRILVQYEHNIETVTFDCPRYWDGHDLSEMGMKIVFQRSDGHKEPHPVENLRVDETDTNMIHFDWTISRNTTLVGGSVSITICAKIADAEGVVGREWHTIPNRDLYVNEGMDCSGDEIVEQNPDIIESILVRLDIAEQGGASDEQIAAAVEAYMTEHPVEAPDSGQNVELDTTLTQSGKAADAKAVGDALDSKLNTVMVSPDGSRWRISIGNDGVLISEKIVVEIPATGIALSASALTFNSSASQTIKATLTPADSTDAVVWNSNNDNVATVSNNGVITPVSNGSCIITASAGAVSASCAITVDVAVVETYSITRNITNATGFDDSAVIGAGSELLECYVSNDECTMDGATATVTMGGVDITATAWDNGVVNIAEVTGDVVITLDAVKIQYVVPPIEDFTTQLHEGVYLLKEYIGTEEAIELPAVAEISGKSCTLKVYGLKLGSSVKHVKVPADMQVFNSGMGYITADKAVMRTCTNYSDDVGNPASGYTMLEKYTNASYTGTVARLYNECSNIRTLAGLEYPDTVTSLKSANNEYAYKGMTGLVDGGVIPAHITKMPRAFYGCTNLRRIRVETTAEGGASSISDPYYQTFYGVSKLDIELYLSGGLWTNLRRDNSLNWNYKFIGGEVHNRIIIIGDSLSSATYSTHLRDLVPLNATVNASAQGGYTSQQIYDSKMMVDPVQQRLPESIVVIWHGTNGYGTDGYDGVTAKMVAALEGNQRYVLIPPTAQGEGDEVYESWKATYGEEHVLSMGDWFSNNGYTVSDYQTDGTHFTADGYALVAQAVHEKIQHWL